MLCYIFAASPEYHLLTSGLEVSSFFFFPPLVLYDTQFSWAVHRWQSEGVGVLSVWCEGVWWFYRCSLLCTDVGLASDLVGHIFVLGDQFCLTLNLGWMELVVRTAVHLARLLGILWQMAKSFSWNQTWGICLGTMLKISNAFPNSIAFIIMSVSTAGKLASCLLKKHCITRLHVCSKSIA